MDNSKGVVYVAFGELYTAKALFSMKTLRRHNNNLPVMIITNLNLDLTVFDFWNPDIDILKIVDADTRENRFIKTNMYQYAPFEKVAYVDADTYILGSFERAWKFLDYFDIAFKLNPVKQTTKGKGDQLILDGTTYVREMPHFNGGVFFYKRSDRAKDFFKRWYEAFRAGGISFDQISLVDSIFKSQAKILPLTDEWNHFPTRKYYAGKKEDPIILHYSNRISFALERELLKIAGVLNFDIGNIEEQIYAKRLVRKAKIGRSSWLKMLFQWRVRPQIERRKWSS